ncbi:hypothetical protein ACEQ8H_000501 [Pleosporales sp. CAS-2024a]
MASAYTRRDLHSALLSLPTEIRCEIYDYLLVDAQSITISAGYMTVFGNRIADRARKHDIPGLPLDLAPLLRQKRDASLLSVATPPEIAIDNGWMDHVAQKDSAVGMPAQLALLLTCRLVHDELTDYMRGRKQIQTARARSAHPTAEEDEPVLKDENEGLSLHVTYPYGVLVLKSMYPYLLKQARRVYITGHYTNPKDAEPGSPTSSDGGEEERLTPSSSFAVAESFGAMPSRRSFRQRSQVNTSWRRAPYTNAPRPRLRLDPPLRREERRLSETEVAFPTFSDETSSLAPIALTHLIRTLFPPTPSQCVKLSARILYPGENSYGTVWADEKSPAVHILKNVCGGKIDMKVKRGDMGTGLLLTARARPDSRIVSTSWENWTGRSGQQGQQGGNVFRRTNRMDVRDLDAFLVAEDKKP